MNRAEIENLFKGSGVDIDLVSKVEKTIWYIELVLGTDYPITHLFISNELNNDEIEFDSTLWIFTERYLIRCIDIKENAKNKKLEYDAIPCSIIKRHNIKAITSMDSLDCLRISIIADKEYVLKSTGDNNYSLLKIYKKYFLEIKVG